MYLYSMNVFFVGTYLPSLGIPDDFNWSSETDDDGQLKSGPVHGSKQFIICANEQEVIEVISIARKHLQGIT
jgi:hypothetical protein